MIKYPSNKKDYKFNESATEDQSRSECKRFTECYGWPMNFSKSPEEIQRNINKRNDELDKSIAEDCQIIEAALWRMATTHEEKLEVFDARIQRTRKS